MESAYWLEPGLPNTRLREIQLLLVDPFVSISSRKETR
jgi:hypothetical protein